MADADRQGGNRPSSSAVVSIAAIRHGLKIRRRAMSSVLSHSLICGTRGRCRRLSSQFVVRGLARSVCDRRSVSPLFSRLRQTIVHSRLQSLALTLGLVFGLPRLLSLNPSRFRMASSWRSLCSWVTTRCCAWRNSCTSSLCAGLGCVGVALSLSTVLAASRTAAASRGARSGVATSPSALLDRRRQLQLEGAIEFAEPRIAVTASIGCDIFVPDDQQGDVLALQIQMNAGQSGSQ